MPARLHQSDGAPGRTRTNTSVRKPDFEAVVKSQANCRICSLFRKFQLHVTGRLSARFQPVVACPHKTGRSIGNLFRQLPSAWRRRRSHAAERTFHIRDGLGICRLSADATDTEIFRHVWENPFEMKRKWKTEIRPAPSDGSANPYCSFETANPRGIIRPE
jgi:hypothetical protein